jgi:hypothetical protein
MTPNILFSILLRGLSLRANYTHRATSACRKLVPTFAGMGCHVVSVTDPYSHILGFLDRALQHHVIKYFFQSKALHKMVDAPWYIPNTVIRRNLQIPTVKVGICRYSSQYSARLSAHPNDVTVNLMELPDNKRLRIFMPNDLPTRFLV